MSAGHVWAVFLLLLIVSGVAPRVRLTEAQGTVYIRADGTVDPSSAPIQRNGDNYTLTGNINASIVVEKDGIVIDGAGHIVQGDGSGVGTDLSGRTNVTVQNVEIVSFYNGIYLSLSYNNKILGNTLTDNKNFAIGSDFFNECPGNFVVGNNVSNNEYGIVLNPYSSNTSLINNNIEANNWVGIDLYYAPNNLVYGNKLTANRKFGIRLNSSSNSTLKNNIMAENGWNLLIKADSIEKLASYDVDVSNTVDGKPVYYWMNKHETDAPLDAGYLALVNCSDVTVKGLNLTNNGEGLLLANTENCTITQNTIAENEIGIHFYKNSNNNSITYNNITGNDEGIVIEQSLSNRVDRNNMTNNSIEFSHSSDNSICHNNMTDSAISLSVSTNNTVSYNNLSGGGIDFYSTSNTVLSYNWLEAHEPGDGITLDSSSNNDIRHNEIKGYYYSFDLEYSSSSNNISQNRITNAGDCFDLSFSSTGNVITGNDVWCNGYFAVLLYDSSSNVFYHNNIFAYTFPVETGFGSGENRWDDGYPSGGNYWSGYGGADVYRGVFQEKSGSDGVGDTPMIMDGGNIDPYPLMKPYAGPHDVGIRFSASKTVVPEGYNRTITANVTVINYGEQAEMLDFTSQVGKAGQEQTLLLAARDSTEFTFNFNVTGWAKGSYPLHAQASQVPGETDVTDNTFTGQLVVTVPGDVNGDGRVDMRDLGYAARRFDIGPTSLLWNPNVDFNDDLKIDLNDIETSAQHFGEIWQRAL